MVVAPVTEHENGDLTCDFIDELERLEATFEENVAGLHAVWRRIQRVGPRALGVSLYHEADTGTGIYEFRKGRIRVYCFESSTGAVVVCSHAIVKKGQVTAKADKKRVAALRTAFEAALAADEVEYVKGEDNGA